MSRMLAFTAPVPLGWDAAVGDDLLNGFGALSRLHADGWGIAGRTDAGGSGEVHVTGDAGPYDDSAARRVRTAPPVRAGMLYLRFASRDAAVSRENAQPFLRDGVAFQHNGALSPRERIVAALAPAERSTLRGTTDSEAYFAVAVRRGIRSQPLSALAAAARDVRELFPEACLNAFVLHPLGLFVVHSPGTAVLPAEAFARRGFAPADLPHGHDRRYNVLSRTVTAHGVTVVATSGVDQSGWEALSPDSVTAVGPSGTARSLPL